jgi:predicted dehydrogenase
VKIGIVGCGTVGEKRAASRGHEIVAVYDIDPARSEALAQRYGARPLSHWRAVIESNIDAVIVATTHDVLSEISLAAVDADRHVLVEKPAGRSSSELAPLAEVASTKKKVVKVGFNHRFHPSLVKAKSIVASDALGPLMYVRGRYGHGGRLGMEEEWRCQPEISGGGELIDQAPHLIDLSRWFLGDVTLDYSFTPTMFWNIRVEDNVFMALRTATNQMAWLHATWTEWKNMFSFEIVGRNGKLVAEGLGGSYGTERLTYHKMLPQMGVPETTAWEFPFPDTSWEAEFKEFVAAIRECRAPSGDVFDALAVLTIIDQVHNGKDS